MQTEKFLIRDIPSVVWGKQSNHVIIAVHGNMSNKTDTVIQFLANDAVEKGYQVLSFDLPKHGDRKGDKTPCKVQNCVEDLSAIMAYVKQQWTNISLFACSMGAYFSLVAYRNASLKQSLFLSPVVNMECIIEKMMKQFQISPEELKEKREITTSNGPTLYWDYYSYVKAHPINHWDVKTAILYGSEDNLCEWEIVSGFANRFHCQMDIMEKGEHYFHTPDQLAVFSNWLKRSVTMLS